MGSIHQKHKPSIHPIDLDACLSPSTLLSIFPSSSSSIIAVIGSSHSAILCLRNLYTLSTSRQRDIRIINFYRSPLKYAQIEADGRIRYDNTGLKGVAAQWAKDYLEVDGEHQVDAASILTRIKLPERKRRRRQGDGDGSSSMSGEQKKEEEDALDGNDEEDTVYATHLHQCTHIVYAIGYERCIIPRISVASTVSSPSSSNEGLSSSSSSSSTSASATIPSGKQPSQLSQLHQSSSSRDSLASELTGKPIATTTTTTTTMPNSASSTIATVNSSHNGKSYTNNHSSSSNLSSHNGNHINDTGSSSNVRYIPPDQIIFNPILGSFTRKPQQDHRHSTASVTGVQAPVGIPIPGLYGCGIAFPQQVVDVSGDKEYAVGFWKFMKFVKSVVGKWIDIEDGTSAAATATATATTTGTTEIEAGMKKSSVSVVDGMIEETKGGVGEVVGGPRTKTKEDRGAW